MVVLPAHRDHRDTWKIVPLAARWPLAALVLALAVYALLRPWGPFGDIPGLPGPVAGSKVVENVEVQGAASSEADAAPGADAAAPSAAAPVVGTADAATLASVAATPPIVAIQTRAREFPPRTRDALGTNGAPKARVSPVRAKAGGGPGQPQTKATRKAAKVAARGPRKTAKPEPARKATKPERRATAQPAKAHVSRQSHGASVAPAARSRAKPAHATKKHVQATAHPVRRHAKPVAGGAKDQSGNAAGKQSKPGSKRR